MVGAVTMDLVCVLLRMVEADRCAAAGEVGLCFYVPNKKMHGTCQRKPNTCQH